MTLETARQFVGACTTGYTAAEREQIAATMAAEDVCLWHAANQFANRRDGTAVPCGCGKCRKGRPPQFTYAGVAGAASDGAPA